MIDISKEVIQINCPNCNAKVNVTLGDVANEKTISCICSSNIMLSDKNGSSTKSIQEINKGFKELDEAFRKLGG